jgi:hypothetical protein
VLIFCELNFAVSIGGQEWTFFGGRPRRRCPGALFAAMISSGAGILWRNRLAAGPADITFWTSWAKNRGDNLYKNLYLTNFFKEQIIKL